MQNKHKLAKFLPKRAVSVDREKDKARITRPVRVEESIYDRVKILAKKNGWTMSWLTDLALAKFISGVGPLASGSNHTRSERVNYQKDNLLTYHE